MKKLVKLVLILIVAAPLIGTMASSCAGESDCSTAGRPQLWISIRTLQNNISVADTLESLSVNALRTDSILFPTTSTVTYLGLPLNFTNDTTTWIFHYGRLTRDTIAIKHTNTPRFLSLECGYEMRQSIVKIISHTKHRIDSIRILSPSTNTNETRNLEFFYR